MSAPVSSNQQLLLDAEAQHYYIALDGSGLLTKNRLLLSGAPNQWKKDPTFVYLRPYHVAGTQEAVAAFFISQGKPVDLSGAYRLGSQATSHYQADIAAQKAYQAAHKPATRAVSAAPVVMLSLSELAAAPIAAAAPRARKAGARSANSPIGRKGPRESLQQRFKDLPAGKSLDVTKMAADGTGVQTVATPGSTSKWHALGKKLLASNNPTKPEESRQAHDNLRRALTELGYAGETIHPGDRHFPVKGGRPKSPPKPRGRRSAASSSSAAAPKFAPVASPVRTRGSPIPVVAAPVRAQSPARRSPARRASPVQTPAQQVAAMPGSFVAREFPVGALPTFNGSLPRLL